MDQTYSYKILHLNDECLMAIFEKVRGGRTKRIWSRVCKRFTKIYCDYYIHKLIIDGYDGNIFDDRLVTKFGHLIGTDLFPLNDIKMLKFDDTYSAYYDRYFFKALRENHRSIEVIELYGFLDKDLNDLLPLPKVTRIYFKYSCVTGKHIDRLQSLEELIMESATSFESKNLLSIVKQNKLRKLAMRDSPKTFSPLHAREIVHNLKYLEEFEVSWSEIEESQFLGTLPRLKVLILNDFKTYQCQKCKEFDRGTIVYRVNAYDFGVCNCGPYEAKLLFNSLLKNGTLEQLIFSGYRLTTRDIVHITKLNSLKVLYMAIDRLPVYVSLTLFGNLQNLEELDLGYSRKLATDALELLQKCQKLKLVNFHNCEGFQVEFIFKAIEIIKKRALLPLKPVKLQLLNPDFDKSVLEEECVKTAKSLIAIDCFKSSDRKTLLFHNYYLL